MRTLEDKAAAFAALAHEGQKRKYTNEDYVVHPKAVAQLVKSVAHDQDMIAAAWLHDVVEDCGVSIQEIETEFGIAVAALVDMLTDVSKPSDGSRKVRKTIDLNHTATASPDAKTIKLADLIDNSQSILKYDPNFAVTYIAEKRNLLKVLTEGNSILWNRANVIVNAF